MTNDEKRGGVYLPSWVLGVLIALFLSVSGWTANTLLETRETMRVVVDRVQRLEATSTAQGAIPTQLARLEATLAEMSKSLAEVREDVRRIRTPERR